MQAISHVVLKKIRILVSTLGLLAIGIQSLGISRALAAPIGIREELNHVEKTLEATFQRCSGAAFRQSLVESQACELELRVLGESRRTLLELLEIRERLDAQAKTIQPVLLEKLLAILYLQPEASKGLKKLFHSVTSSLASVQMDSEDWDQVQDFLKKNRKSLKDFEEKRTKVGIKLYLFQRLLRNSLQGDASLAAFERLELTLKASTDASGVVTKLTLKDTGGVYLNPKTQTRITERGPTTFSLSFGRDGTPLNENFEVTFDSKGNSYLLFGRFLGEGWGKNVDLAYATSSWQEYARASAKWRDRWSYAENWEIRKAFRREIKILKALQALPGEQRSTLIGITDVSDTQFFMPRYFGELFDQVAAETLTPVQKLHITLDLAKGIKALHSINVVYKDIKMENVFVSPVLGADGAICDWTSVCGDFGLGERLGTCVPKLNRHIRAASGSPDYFAPELLYGTWIGANNDEVIHNAKQADVFSLGVFHYILNEGFLPFGGTAVEQRELAANRVRGKIVDYNNLYLMQLLYYRAFLPDPRNRISLDDYVALLEQISQVQTALLPFLVGERGDVREAPVLAMSDVRADLGDATPVYSGLREMTAGFPAKNLREAGSYLVWLQPQGRGGEQAAIYVSIVDPSLDILTKRLADVDAGRIKQSVEVNVEALRMAKWISNPLK